MESFTASRNFDGFNFINTAWYFVIPDTSVSIALYPLMIPLFSRRSILFLIVLSETSWPIFYNSAAISFDGVLALLLRISIIFWSTLSRLDSVSSLIFDKSSNAFWIFGWNYTEHLFFDTFILLKSNLILKLLDLLVLQSW